MIDNDWPKDSTSVDVALGSTLVGARATIDTPDALMERAVLDKMPEANLELIRHNEGRDGVKILIWRYMNGKFEQRSSY